MNTVVAPGSKDSQGAPLWHGKLLLPIWGIAIAALFVFGGLLVWNGYQEYQRTLEQEFRFLESHARFGDAQISGTFRSLNLILQEVIDSRLSSSALPAAGVQRRQLEFLKQFPEIHYLIVTDRTGQVISAESLDDPIGVIEVRKFNAAQREYFTVHRDAKLGAYQRYAISRPFKTITNRNTIAISRAIRGKDGEFQGIAVVSISPKLFDNVLRQILPADDSSATVLQNRLGDVIYRLPDPENNFGKNVASGSGFKAFINSNQPLIRHIGASPIDGAQRVMVFSKVDDTDLGVSVTRELDVVMAAWHHDQLLRLLSFLLIAALTLALAWEIQRRVLARQAMLDVEKRFHAYFERSMVGMATTSPDKGWIDVNPALCEMLGYTSAQLCTKTWAELTHADDLAADEQQFAKLLSGAINEYELDKRFIRCGGAIVYTHLAVRAVRNPDGQVDYLVVLVEDITERKHAELLLHDSEERLRLALSAARQGWFDLNLETGAAVVGPEYAKLLGYEPDGFQSSLQNWFDNVHPDDRRALEAEFQHALASGEAVEMAYRRSAKAGDWVWISSIGRVVERDAGGKPLRMTGIHTDITARKLAELALRDSKERFERTAETVPVVLYDYVLDGDGSSRFVYMSRRSKDILGVDAEVIMADSNRFWSLVHPEDLPRLLEEDAAANQEGDVFNTEFRIATPTAEQKWLHVESKPNPRRPGEPVIWSGFMLDITDRKRMDDELRKMATTDFLTGLPSRRSFITRLEDELARLHRGVEQPIALLMLDLDHFKRVNDTRGHATGDALLKHFAVIVADELRRIDMAGRLGGEEFGIILPGADTNAANVFAERLCQRVANSPLLADRHSISFTVSIGVTNLKVIDTDPEVALARVDKALYRAKELGRNRVEIAEAA